MRDRRLLMIAATALAVALTAWGAYADSLPAIVKGAPAPQCQSARQLLCVPAPECDLSTRMPAPLPPAISDAYDVLSHLTSGAWTVIGPARRARIARAAATLSFLESGACYVPPFQPSPRSTGQLEQTLAGR